MIYNIYRQYRTNRRTHLACILFRHLDQIFLDLRQQACVKFSQSDEKARCFSNVAKTRHGCREIKLRLENTDGAICARYLCGIAYTANGVLAQLGARHTGSVEVRGSNPLCSTSGGRAAANPPTDSSVGGFLCRITQVLRKFKAFGTDRNGA